VLCAPIDDRFLDGSPDGTIYAVMCFLVRFAEAVGAAALLTSSFAIIANTFPDNVATMFVRIAALDPFIYFAVSLPPPRRLCFRLCMFVCFTVNI